MDILLHTALLDKLNREKTISRKNSKIYSTTHPNKLQNEVYFIYEGYFLRPCTYLSKVQK